jgi:hypothetical protein
VVFDNLCHARAYGAWRIVDPPPGDGLIGMVCPDCKMRLLEAHGTTEPELLGVEA